MGRANYTAVKLHFYTSLAPLANARLKPSIAPCLYLLGCQQKCFIAAGNQLNNVSSFHLPAGYLCVKKFNYCCRVIYVDILFINVISGLVTRNSELSAESDVIKIKKNKLTVMFFC